MWSLKLCKHIWKGAKVPASKYPIAPLSNIGIKDGVGRRRIDHSTIDTNDVDHFSILCKEWWDLNGPMKMLHRMNEVRIQLIRDCLTQGSADKNTALPLKDKTILDVGCGGGILTEELARLGANVTGVDASPDLIKIAQEHIKINPNIADLKPTYYNTTVEEHAKSFSDHYDSIVASEIIEHVTNQELFVQSCVRALKPGGKIIFTTPNRTWWSQFVIIIFSEDVVRLIPKGTHQYEKFITPKELGTILEKSNCVIQFSSGLSFNPLTETWKTTNSQRLVYSLQAMKL